MDFFQRGVNVCAVQEAHEASDSGSDQAAIAGAHPMLN
jgi:hypothetical protein